MRPTQASEGAQPSLGRGKGRSITMKKINVVGFAMFAVLAFSVLSVATASATQFLISGEPVLASTLVFVEGELLLEDMGAAGSPDVLCSGVFDVDIVNSELAEILALLDLETLALLTPTGAVGTETDGLADMIDCAGQKTCEGSENLVTFSTFPWHIDLELMAGAGKLEFLLHFLTVAEAGSPYGELGYTWICKTFIGNVEDTCTGLTSAMMENMPTEKDALAIFSSEAESEAGICTVGGAGQQLFEGEFLMYIEGGLEISVSE